jgi:RNA polymerase sigma factor (sigma-70 family)
MNVHFSYKTAKPPEFEKEFKHHIQKLQRRLQVFRPELVHLHGIVEQNSTREGTVVSLNLRLPSGQLAAQKSASTAVAALKLSFVDLLSQLNKHKDQLRGQQRKKLRRSIREQQLPPVPFEQTLAAVHPPTVSNQDVRSWVNANLARLESFAERELVYRQALGMLAPPQVTKEEVIDEVIAAALGDEEERPELLSLERWLYRLAIRAIGRLGSANGEAVTAVPLEASARRQNVKASDEPALQFHQPDELFLTEEVIADRRVRNPEEVACSEEMITLVEAALLSARPEDREAFILSAIEGFTVSEIAVTTDRTNQEVRASIAAAREHLRENLRVPNPFKEKLLQHPKTA